MIKLPLFIQNIILFIILISIIIYICYYFLKIERPAENFQESTVKISEQNNASSSLSTSSLSSSLFSCLCCVLSVQLINLSIESINKFTKPL